MTRRLVNYKVVVPVGVAFVAVFGYWMAGRCSEPGGPGGELVAQPGDGSEIWTGELDTDALAQAPSVSDVPILWPGEEFEGYALTRFVNLGREWLLEYGACRVSSSPEPSCVPPIQVQVRPRGEIPPVGYFSPVPFRGVERTPGERGLRPGATESWLIWLPGGSTVKVYVSEYVVGDITDALMEELRSANHEVMGYAEVGPGESLAGMP